MRQRKCKGSEVAKSKPKSLTQELDELIALADRQAHAYKSARDLLWEALSKLLVWWMRANRQKGYLDKLYKQRGIQYKATTDRSVNFSPLLRLVWGMDATTHSATIDQWNRALNKLYLEAQTNADYYNQQTVQRLISFISTNGGITELAGYNAADVDPANDPAFASSASAKRAQLSQTMRDNAHFDAGTLYFATQAAPIAKITTAKVLPTSNSNLAVGLLRKKGNSYELLGATDDDDTLRQAVIKAYKRTNSKQSDTVRVITEIIRTQALPASMSALARKLADKTKILAANGAAMSAIKRLRYRGKSKTFLLSPSRTDCAVVTIAKPFVNIFAAKSDVALSPNDRAYIETALIQAEDFNLFDADGDHRVPKVTDEESATYKLRLEVAPLV